METVPRYKNSSHPPIACILSVWKIANSLNHHGWILSMGWKLTHHCDNSICPKMHFAKMKSPKPSVRSSFTHISVISICHNAQSKTSMALLFSPTCGATNICNTWIYPAINSGPKAAQPWAKSSKITKPWCSWTLKTTASRIWSVSSSASTSAVTSTSRPRISQHNSTHCPRYAQPTWTSRKNLLISSRW